MTFIFHSAKRHGERTSTASQLGNKINKVPLLLQNLDILTNHRSRKRQLAQIHKGESVLVHCLAGAHRAGTTGSFVLRDVLFEFHLKFYNNSSILIF